MLICGGGIIKRFLVVPGLSFPIEVGASHDENGILLSLSFEHSYSEGGSIIFALAHGQIEDLGDTSTLADPSVVQTLVKERVA